MAKGIPPSPPPPPPLEDLNNNPSAHHSSVNHNSGSATYRNGLPLTLPLAIPLYTPPIEEVQEGGDILFQNYVAEQFHQEHISDPPLLVNSTIATNNVADREVAASGDGLRLRAFARGSATTPEGYKNNTWSKIGKDLRDLANEFAESSQGARVRERARTTELNDITEEGFFNLLNELFSEGFSRERLIALFYYCALLLIRSRRSNNESLTKHLFLWSLNYIRSKVCQWVYEHGGWERVLRRLYDVVVKVAVVSLLAVGIFCGLVYIKKNW